MWGRRLDDYASFYSYEQVVALVDVYNEALGYTTVGGSNRIDDATLRSFYRQHRQM